MITFTNAQLAIIAENTDFNHHGENYALISELLGLKKMAQNFKAINTIHENVGHLDGSTSALRRSFYEQMIKFAEQNVTNFKDLYNSL